SSPAGPGASDPPGAAASGRGAGAASSATSVAWGPPDAAAQERLVLRPGAQFVASASSPAGADGLGPLSAAAWGRLVLRPGASVGPPPRTRRVRPTWAWAVASARQTWPPWILQT